MMGIWVWLILNIRLWFLIGMDVDIRSRRVDLEIVNIIMDHTLIWLYNIWSSDSNHNTILMFDLLFSI